MMPTAWVPLLRASPAARQWGHDDPVSQLDRPQLQGLKQEPGILLDLVRDVWHAVGWCLRPAAACNASGSSGTVSRYLAATALFVAGSTEPGSDVVAVDSGTHLAEEWSALLEGSTCRVLARAAASPLTVMASIAQGKK